MAANSKDGAYYSASAYSRKYGNLVHPGAPDARFALPSLSYTVYIFYLNVEFSKD